MLDVYKTCTLCHKTLPLSCFGINRTKKDGHHNICKECRRKYDKQRLEKLIATAEDRRQRARATGTKKYCPYCGRDLPFSYFSRDYKRPDGFTALCRECRSEKYHRSKGLNKADLKN